MTHLKITDINRDDLTTRLVSSDIRQPPFAWEKDFLEWASKVPKYAKQDVIVEESIKRRFASCINEILETIYNSAKIQAPERRPQLDNVSFVDGVLKVPYAYAGGVSLTLTWGVPTVLYAKAVINTASPYLVDLAVEINDKANSNADGLKAPILGKESRGNLLVAAFYHVWDIDKRMGDLRSRLELDNFYPKVKQWEKALHDGLPSEKARNTLQEEYSSLLKEIAGIQAYQELFRFGEQDLAHIR